jgi:hypothetical protein
MKVHAAPRPSLVAALCVLIISIGFVGGLQAQSDCSKPAPTTVGSMQRTDPTYEGEPLSFWLDVIRKRGDRMPMAFEAIRSLGPLAESAVPILESIVAEPFLPIKIGEDKHDVILSKLLNIQLRADAVDALALIGPVADCSTKALIRWALTVRVIPASEQRVETDSLYVEMVGIDVLERMRVAGAVPELGKGALVAIAPLLASGNGEKRKLAVAILSERTLPLAVSLLKSPDCDEKKLGLSILGDMWPVVPETHLLNLKESFMCDTN